MVEDTEEINLKILKKAHLTLKKFIDTASTEIEKARVVQAFEFCYELSWKTIKRFLSNEGITVSSPRESFRAAGRSGLIEDVKLWLDFIIIRNKTVHTYNELVLEEIIDIVPTFEKEFNSLIEKLESKIWNDK
jgi:nucleotidyltransferase substrate binding protein (TIGR01987 family)